MTLRLLMTAAECVFGYWLTTIGWPMAGGVVIGLAIGSQIGRMAYAATLRETLLRSLQEDVK